ncbi:MAG: hypothetical protein GQ570_06350 [Helicobacteraceae bacterium]|nr:hypothetical protein [Helicobacteraceae bacterium]
MLKFLLFLYFSIVLNATNFTLVKKDSLDSEPTLLVIGGIHGNEPGGYFAPAILAQHYDISRGSLWVVPDLNRKSIQVNSRGLNGDMNRKFATLKSKDRDAQTIKEIKELILNKRVSLVLNLHDGHGFYRKEHKGTIFNPNAWGQTCVIDQCSLDKSLRFGNLDEVAKKVSKHLNSTLIKDHHKFSVKNTQTKFDDEAMQLSLTYFAVTHNKPAFAIETSKNLSSLSQKVYYQLSAIEAYMDIMGIKYSRDFVLNEKNIANLLNDKGSVLINGNIFLSLNDLRKYLKYVPLKRAMNSFEFTNTLGSVKKIGSSYVIYVGNKRVSTLKPQYFKMKKLDKLVDIEVDSELLSSPIPSVVVVGNSFNIKAHKSLRVNVIGFSTKKQKNESNIKITRSQMQENFSIDVKKSKYRVEFYKGNSFCGMIIIDFKGKAYEKRRFDRE